MAPPAPAAMGTAASGRRRQWPAARSGRRASGSRSTAWPPPAPAAMGTAPPDAGAGGPLRGRAGGLPDQDRRHGAARSGRDGDRRLRTPAPVARCAVGSAGFRIKVDGMAAAGPGRDGDRASGRRRRWPAARSGRRASGSRSTARRRPLRPRWGPRLRTPAPVARCAVGSAGFRIKVDGTAAAGAGRDGDRWRSGRIKVERCFETRRMTLQDSKDDASRVEGSRFETRIVMLLD
jgi:hypothetical protein